MTTDPNESKPADDDVAGVDVAGLREHVRNADWTPDRGWGSNDAVWEFGITPDLVTDLLDALEAERDRADAAEETANRLRTAHSIVASSALAAQQVGQSVDYVAKSLVDLSVKEAHQRADAAEADARRWKSVAEDDRNLARKALAKLDEAEAEVTRLTAQRDGIGDVTSGTLWRSERDLAHCKTEWSAERRLHWEAANQRDELAATLEQVEALADQWESMPDQGGWAPEYASALRTALEGDDR